MEALIVFVKNPELGKVKTRLANSVGATKALSVYKDLLEFTKRVIPSELSVYVFHSPVLLEELFWSGSENELQCEGDLGLKMKTALQQVFSKGATKVCLIGSDCFEISEEHIKSAFKALDSNDLVFGPAKDGGYYLVGMKQMHAEVFEGMPWSRSNLLEKTITKIKGLKLNYKLMETLNDVDFVEDLPSDYKV